VEPIFDLYLEALTDLIAETVRTIRPKSNIRRADTHRLVSIDPLDNNANLWDIRLSPTLHRVHVRINPHNSNMAPQKTLDPADPKFTDQLAALIALT
jgi:hypothetical protein